VGLSVQRGTSLYRGQEQQHEKWKVTHREQAQFKPQIQKPFLVHTLEINNNTSMRVTHSDPFRVLGNWSWRMLGKTPWCEEGSYPWHMNVRVSLIWSPFSPEDTLCIANLLEDGKGKGKIASNSPFWLCPRRYCSCLPRSLLTEQTENDSLSQFT
jgi:hypothetical protein